VCRLHNEAHDISCCRTLILDIEKDEDVVTPDYGKQRLNDVMLLTSTKNAPTALTLNLLHGHLFLQMMSAFDFSENSKSLYINKKCT
jgi:hypothetical protein